MTLEEQHLVVVAPHPDDETLAVGGTIHDHVRHGGSCEIVAVTDGEAADDRSDASGQAAMAAVRGLERAAALAILGGGAIGVTTLQLPDREVALHERPLAAELDVLFRSARKRFSSCAIVLPWSNDPHPDHQATARAGVRAALKAGLGHLEVPIWAWYHPSWRRRLPQSRLRRLAVSPAAREAKQAALRCFESQTQPLPFGRGPVLPHDFFEAFAGRHEMVLT